MRVGFLSTYNTRCGIAEYTQGLLEGMWANNIRPTVFCNHSTGDRLLGEYPTYATPVFWVWYWENKTGLEIHKILAKDFDVFHIQYHGMFYRSNELNTLMTGLKAKGTKIVVTFHDTAILSDVDQALIDVRLSHREEITHDKVIPIGVPTYKPIITTFGIGRTQVEKIRRVCDQLGYQLEVLDGSQGWMSRDDLHTWLKRSDAIVLWYDETHVVGSSQAARTALATRRPVYLNSDVSWFKDLQGPDSPYNFFDSHDMLTKQLQMEFSGEADLAIHRHSWKEVAAMIRRIYDGAIG